MVEGDLPGIPKRKAENNIDRWDYETHFGEYVSLLGSKGNEALESIDKFPTRIELDNTWHGILNRMRKETKSHKHEVYTMIGYRENSRDLYFPEAPIKGEPSRIPRSLKSDMNWTAWEKYGVTSIIGDIHTHPNDSPFSVQDLYGFLNRLTAPKPFIAGLANEKENIFAFRTRETFMVSELDTKSRWFSEVFKDYWREKAGFEYKDDRSHLIRTDPSADWWKANLGIAEAHRLVLYRGNPNEDLVRIHTDQSLKEK